MICSVLGEVGIVVGIASHESFLPAGPHLEFIGFGLALFPRQTFVVDQATIRGEYRLVPMVSSPEAEVDIVTSHRKIFVKTAQLGKDFSPRHQTGAGTGRDLAGYAVDVAIDPRTRPQALQEVADTAAMVDQKGSGVLDAAVRIEQQAANRANFRADRLAGQLLQPMALDNFDIVVQEEEKIAGCLLRSPVVEPGPVEGFRAGDDRSAG